MSIKAIVQVAMVVAIAIGSAACSSGADEAPAARRDADAAPTSLLYLRAGAIVQRDLATQTERVVGRVETEDVFPIPGRADRFLAVRDRGSGEDFAEDPILSVIDTSGRPLFTIGPGHSPLPSPDGGRIAYLRSAGERICEGETCFGSVTVHVAGPDGGSRRLLPPRDWHLISWARSSLVVAAAGQTAIVPLEGAPETVTVKPSSVWGATPDGRRLLLSSSSGVGFLELSSGDVQKLDIEGLVAEGAWGPQGDLIAVEVAAGRTSLTRISSAGDVESVAGSRGASGPILWGRDGSFAYVRAAGFKLETIFCPRGGACRPVLRWREGALPLALR